MYNLLVVDDEAIITDGLYEIFYYNEELELEVFKAYSAFEALELAKSTRIDLMVSDISMPRMNGLELHRAISEIWPQCKTIFLTGYDNFEYIQSALRDRAIDYVLKSESDEVVVEAVKKSITLIESEKRELHTLRKAKNDITLALPMLQEQLIREMVYGTKYSVSDMQSQFEELRIPMDPGYPVLLLLGSVDSWPEGFTFSQQSITLYNIKNFVSEYLSKSSRVFAIELTQTQLIWLIQPNVPEPAPEWNKIATYVHGMLNTVQTDCKEIYQVSVSFATNRQPLQWSEIGGKLDSLMFAMTQSLIFGNEVLLIDERQSGLEDEAYTSDNENESGIRRELTKSDVLVDLLEGGKSQEFQQHLGAMMKNIGDLRPFSREMGAEIYFTISLVFLSYLNKNRLKQKIEQKISLEKLTKMDETMPWEKIESYFSQIADFIFKLNDTESFNNANRVFRFIKNYTEQHINEELSLTKFSELLHFHPFYLSRLFKQVTGKSLSDYVLEAKIRKAREMIRNENGKINEIASYLGFTSSSYFAKVFKKYTDVNPQEYKESLKA